MNYEIIKVCGMRDADNIRELDEANIADWMGFIFFEKSKRHVNKVPAYLPKNSKRVGVFVNYSVDEIAEKVNDFGFNLVQLHGNESAEFCSELKAKLGDKVKLIKMFQISNSQDFQPCGIYETIVDYFLFETKCDSYGGSGKQFDWDLLNRYPGLTPFILTGGIGPDDADKIKAFQHPLCAGIDLNSKFEISPAFKDIDLLKNFIKQLR
ncbi:MAG: phosphoribosylanthranilate isomerase [Bacteroidaceae bacterium]|nr:phosphoribosylanthranilate isomerase [Bacteroidaceae bacterium]